MYLGNLNPNVDKSEVQREFQKFGALADVWVARNPPGFSFLEFEDARDAEVLIYDLARLRSLVALRKPFNCSLLFLFGRRSTFDLNTARRIQNSTTDVNHVCCAGCSR